MAIPFATTADLALRWRALTADETPRADALLEDASATIRAACPDIDARIADGFGTAVPRAVACAMVKRAMQGAGFDGVTQQSQTAGPFAQATTFANPLGDLYLTKDERRRLRGRTQRAGSVDLLGGV